MGKCPIDVDTEVCNARSRIDLGHQEVQRIVEELENIYEMSHSDWLAADPISSFLCSQVGYDDVDELEDALNGTFEEFLDVLPHVETKRVATEENEGDDQYSLYFRILGPGCNPSKMRLKIDQRQQLWNVLLKSPTCTLEFPEIEFEILPEGRRRIDTIWGFLASAALDLEIRLQQRQNNIQQSEDPEQVDEEVVQLQKVVDSLRSMRDVDEPWTLIVRDPKGETRFAEMNSVDIITEEPV